MSDQKLVRAAGSVGLAVLASRILGLFRDQVFAFCFGAQYLNDAFQAAFRIPNLLRDLFAEGALSTAFVTVFSRKKAQEGDEAAWKLSRQIMTLQIVGLGVIVVLGIIFAPAIVSMIASGFTKEPGKLELTITLTRIMFPFILFVGMAALSMGVLNAYGSFGLPASASSFFNLGSIVLGLGLALIFDPQFHDVGIICMAIGTVGGGILQWLVQVPALRELGYRYKPEWNLKDPGVREIGKLMGPAIIGVSAVQINVVINTIFASHLGNGVVSHLMYAFRLIQLPIGMFGVAIATAALPSLSVDAALENKDAFRDRVEHSLRLNAALCIPAACGLALLSIPLLALLFEYGRFTHTDTMLTARILCAYAAGLIGYASIKVLAPPFYALNKPMTPMLVSIGSIVTTVLLNAFFVYKLQLGAVGLAFTTSASSLISAGILLAVFSGMMGAIESQTWKTLGKILINSAVMSGIVWATLRFHAEFQINTEWSGNLSRVLVGTILGLFVYFRFARILKIPEVMELEEGILSRLKRS